MRTFSRGTIIRFSEQRSRFHSHPVSQSTPLSNRPGLLNREQVRLEARSVLENAELREEMDDYVAISADAT